MKTKSDERCGCKVRHEEGRMCSPALKREFIDRLLAEWERCPELHFGHWIRSVSEGTDLEQLDDAVLLTLAEDFGDADGGMSSAEAEELSRS